MSYENAVVGILLYGNLLMQTASTSAEKKAVLSNVKLALTKIPNDEISSDGMTGDSMGIAFDKQLKGLMGVR
jgi:hypothetical protein